MRLLYAFVSGFMLMMPCAAQLPQIIKRPQQVPSTYKTTYVRELETTLKYSAQGGVTGNEAIYVNHLLAYSKTALINSGGIYYTWNQGEAYLNAILTRLLQSLPDTFITRPHVYMGFDSEFNASALHDGTFIFNVGSFLYLDNEAEIAAILAHELAHYLQQHVIESVKLYYTSAFDTLNGKKERLAYNSQIFSMNRNRESEADSIGFTIFAKSGYKPSAFVSVNKKLNNYSESFKRFFTVRAARSKPGFSTHPAGEARIAFAQRQLASLSDTSGAYFIQPQADFVAIKKQARIETMEEMLLNGDYALCMEMSFMNYLQDTADNNNIYYILESMRKYCFSTMAHRSAVFLSSLYYSGAYYLSGDAVVNALTPSVMRRLDKVFPADKIESIVQDKHLLEHPGKVHGTRETFEYFADIARRRKLLDCYLSIALHHAFGDQNQMFNNPRFDENIEAYARVDTARYRDYALYLIGLRDTKPYKNNLSAVYFSNQYTYEYINKNPVTGYYNYDSLENQAYRQLKKDATKKGRDFFNVKTLSENNVDLPVYLSQFETLIATSDPEMVIQVVVINNATFSLLYFDPFYYYQFIKGKNYDEVIFVDVYDETEVSKNQTAPIVEYTEEAFLGRTIYQYRLSRFPSEKFSRKKDHQKSFTSLKLKK
ncbi:MAG: M48 family metallopeptidase [Flavobacteriales bacterium]